MFSKAHEQIIKQTRLNSHGSVFVKQANVVYGQGRWKFGTWQSSTYDLNVWLTYKWFAPVNKTLLECL